MEHLCLIVDESGSMFNMANVVYDGAREIATGLSENGSACLVHFNTNVTIDDDISKEQAVNSLSSRHCVGGTALYDAICMGIEHTIASHSHQDSVVVAIVTDGIENSSTRKSVSDVRQAVETAQNKRWRVTFLGSNQDAVLTANNLGIRGDNALTYGNNELGARGAFRSLSAANGRYVRGESEGFTTTERQTSMGGTHVLPPDSRSISTRTSNTEPVWISLDPRNGHVIRYDSHLCAMIEESWRSQHDRQSLSPTFDAVIYFSNDGKHLQKTSRGERDVRRINNANTSIPVTNLIDINGHSMYRIVPPQHPNVQYVQVS